MRQYHIQDRDDYKKYNKICGLITKLVSILRHLDPTDPTRIELTDAVLDKYDLDHSKGKQLRLTP